MYCLWIWYAIAWTVCTAFELLKAACYKGCVHASMCLRLSAVVQINLGSFLPSQMVGVSGYAIRGDSPFHAVSHSTQETQLPSTPPIQPTNNNTTTKVKKNNKHTHKKWRWLIFGDLEAVLAGRRRIEIPWWEVSLAAALHCPNIAQLSSEKSWRAARSWSSPNWDPHTWRMLTAERELQSGITRLAN